MDKMSFAKSWLANPDKNPLLHKLLRVLFYNHFAAGENDEQVGKTIREMKKMGFNGVILGYGKECNAEHHDGSVEATDAVTSREIEQWREGTLRTLNMLDAGDFLAIK